MTRKNEFTDVFKFIDYSAGPDKCWPWTGSVSRDGTPYITIDGRKYVAYRVVKWLTEGGWNLNDERIAILHSCTDEQGNPIDDRLCCNPSHTRRGTHEENTLDAMIRGRTGKLTVEAIRAIVKMNKEFPELTHGQIAARIEHKYETPCARQTVTDILSMRRRAALQAVIREDDAVIEGSGDTNAEKNS